jgi:hypothetical protein
MYRLPYVLISSGVLVDTKGDSNKAIISNPQSVINHKQIVLNGYARKCVGHTSQDTRRIIIIGRKKKIDQLIT